MKGCSVENPKEELKKQVEKEQDFILSLLDHGRATIRTHGGYIGVIEQLFAMGSPTDKEKEMLKRLKADCRNMKEAVQEIEVSEKTVYEKAHEIIMQGEARKRGLLRKMRALREQGKKVLNMTDEIGTKISNLKNRMKRWSMEEGTQDPHIFWGSCPIQVVKRRK